MKQINKIYDYILSNSKEFTKEKLLKTKGFSAQEVGEHLAMLRSFSKFMDNCIDPNHFYFFPCVCQVFLHQIYYCG